VVDPWGGAGQRRSGAHQGAAPNGVGASMGHKETSGAFGALAARAALLKDGEDPRQVGIFDRPARSPERAAPAPAIPLPTDVQRVVGGLLATYDAGGNVYTFAAVGDMLAIYAPSVRIYWTDRGYNFAAPPLSVEWCRERLMDALADDLRRGRRLDELRPVVRLMHAFFMLTSETLAGGAW